VPILIDGHNLIGRLPGLSLQDANDEEGLVRRLVSYRARTGKGITVVFDPGPASQLPRSRRLGAVEVVFAAVGSNADAVIARRVQRSQNPSGWLVVTSDQELARTVMHYGARVRSAEAFAAELGGLKDGPPDRTEAGLSSEEVESWLALFESRGARKKKR
jgi:predicted RNA-binding protein with PIN domain